MHQKTGESRQIVRYVFTREGSSPAAIAEDVASEIASTCTDPETRERALDFAGLVMVRLGMDAGTNLLRHWIEHDPALLCAVDPVLVDILANTPELITGALRA